MEIDQQIGWKADLTIVKQIWGSLGNLHTEVEERRAGARRAVERLEALLLSLEDLEASSAPVIRKRLRSELPEIIELLYAYGPIAWAEASADLAR
jgi:hypothetical protein